jgi:DNA helicase-2/ATP-dependent DNA helicase PcrA
MIDLLSSLNPSQRLAVQTIDGPLLIIAGAGTGKTQTLFHRLAFLSSIHGIPAEKLLAITFTTKAANEMRERVFSLCRTGIDLSGLFVGTIHSLCYQILKNEGRAHNAAPDFALLSPADQALILKNLMPEFFPGSAPGAIKKYALLLSREKNELAAELQSSPASRSPFLQAYQTILEKESRLDFDDLIINTLAILKKYPSITGQLRSRFSHISVDEYQDVNTAQYLLIRELAGPFPNLCAVGDADQAIYAFRGAQVKNFLQFQNDFPGATIVRLEQNYRSTGTIIVAALQVIEKNSERIDKKLIAVKAAGAKIEVCEMLDEHKEAQFIAREIGRLLGGTSFETLAHFHPDETSPAKSFKDIALLYRLHAQSRLLRKALEQEGIPVQVATSLALYEEPDVEAIVNMLEIIDKPENDFALGELLLNAVRGLGPKTVQSLTNLAFERHSSIFTMLSTSSSLQEEISADKRDSLDALLNLIQELKDKSLRMPLDELIREVHEKLPAQQSSPDSAVEQSAPNDENLLDLLTAVMPFCHVPAAEGIPLFLEKLSLLNEGATVSPQPEAVTLLTVHGAKGLEFPVVFITGLEEGLFPYYMNTGEDETDNAEEERRLFYVGMTRAQDKLYLTHARSRFLFGERRALPRSSFLADIHEETLTHYTDPLIKKHLQEKHKKKVKQMSLFQD